MEVKNPLFKEDFSASSQNLFSSPSLSTLPPAYSTLGSAAASAGSQPTNEQPSSSAAESSKQETSQLIQLESAVPGAVPTTTVTVESENATTPKQ